MLICFITIQFIELFLWALLIPEKHLRISWLKGYENNIVAYPDIIDRSIYQVLPEYLAFSILKTPNLV